MLRNSFIESSVSVRRLYFSKNNSLIVGIFTDHELLLRRNNKIPTKNKYRFCNVVSIVPICSSKVYSDRITSVAGHGWFSFTLKIFINIDRNHKKMHVYFVEFDAEIVLIYLGIGKLTV